MTNIFEIREQILSGKKSAVEFVKEAISKAEKLEEELDSLKNEIQILSKNFAQEE